VRRENVLKAKCGKEGKEKNFLRLRFGTQGGPEGCEKRRRKGNPARGRPGKGIRGGRPDRLPSDSGVGGGTTIIRGNEKRIRIVVTTERIQGGGIGKSSKRLPVL